MRYISFYDEFALHNRNGNVRHKFWQGELIVGDPTTKTGTGNSIDTAVNGATLSFKAAGASAITTTVVNGTYSVELPSVSLSKPK